VLKPNNINESQNAFTTVQDELTLFKWEEINSQINQSSCLISQDQSTVVAGEIQLLLITKRKKQKPHFLHYLVQYSLPIVTWYATTLTVNFTIWI